MHVPRESSRVEATLATFLPALRLAHRLGLARWIGARRPHGVTRHALRQRRREWPYDEAAKPGAGNP